MEFLSEKNNIFSKWLDSEGGITFDQLKSLIVREEFLNSLPDVRIHILDLRNTDNQKVAECADTYTLVHRKSPVPYPRLNPVLPLMGDSNTVCPYPYSRSHGASRYSRNTSIVCKYCKKSGHVIKNCYRRAQNQRDISGVAHVPMRNVHHPSSSQPSVPQSSRGESENRCSPQDSRLSTTTCNVRHGPNRRRQSADTYHF